MSRNGKVVVAMSGGVDSSVAACLLKEQGYECVGVFMRVGGAGQAQTEIRGQVSEAPEFPIENRKSKIENRRHGCCSVADALDARAVAGRLGIPFYVLNFEPDFAQIVDYFVDEYARARTPNPCVVCNIQLKFGKLLRYADLLGAEYVATGHYARVVSGKMGKWGGGKVAETVSAAEKRVAGRDEHGDFDQGGACLARAANLAKDQSYVLFGIRRADLPRCRFPLGEMTDKATVRRIAAELGLTVHDKPDSQEICFVPDNDYRELLRARRPESLRPGTIVDPAGRVLGTHEGVGAYTIGQRRGLGVAAGAPVYVTRLDVAANTVTLGPREGLLAGGLVAERFNWLVDAPSADEWHAAWVKIRHMHTAAPGRLRVRAAGGTLDVLFSQPQSAVTPGQAAVCYDENGIVLGGGWIEQALPAVPQ